MNYNALTIPELGRLAMTDAGARAYIGENAEALLVDAQERAEFDVQFRVDDAYQDGEDAGSNAEREHIRETLGEKIFDLLRSEIHIRDHKKVRELLEFICDELGLVE